MLRIPSNDTCISIGKLPRQAAGCAEREQALQQQWQEAGGDEGADAYEVGRLSFHPSSHIDFASYRA